MKFKLTLYASIVLYCTTIIVAENGQTLLLGRNFDLTEHGLIDNKTHQKINALSVKFAWDLDDTLMHPNKLNALWKLISANTPIFVGTLAYAYLTDPEFPEIMQGGAERIARKMPILREFILSLANSIQPIPGSLTVVEELNASGHTQYLATNKERLLLHEALDNNPTAQPLFAIISSGLARDMQEHAAQPASSIAADHFAYTTYKKPQQGYYQTFEDTYNPEHAPMVFVDDKKVNVQAAVELHPHWIGIVFENPGQLRRDLIALGILTA